MINEMKLEEIEVVGGGTDVSTGPIFRWKPGPGVIIIVCPPPTFPVEIISE